MGLKEQIQSATYAAFASLDNLMVTGKYRTYTSERDADYSLDRVASNQTIKCLVTQFHTKEIEAAAGMIPATDTKIIVPRTGINFLVEILAGNEIVIGTTIYQIIAVQTDPAESVYTIQGRK